MRTDPVGRMLRKHREKSKFPPFRTKPLILLGVGVLGVAIFAVSVWLQYISFNRNIGGHLILASNANQPGTAIQEMEAAIKGMDAEGHYDCHEPSQCFTSILYTEPSEDVGFWRMNITQTLEDLRALPEDADHLTVSNTLMKVRESLSGADGRLLKPAGIEVFPHNTAYAVAFLFFGGLIGGWILWILVSIIRGD